MTSDQRIPGHKPPASSIIQKDFLRLGFSLKESLMFLKSNPEDVKEKCRIMLAQTHWKRHCGELLWHSELVQHFHQRQISHVPVQRSSAVLKGKSLSKIYFNEAMWFAATAFLYNQEVRKSAPSEMRESMPAFFPTLCAKQTSHISYQRTCSCHKKHKRLFPSQASNVLHGWRYCFTEPTEYGNNIP
ncbi:hypothetical protein MJG53_008395 [Ovis ammon polii x Ovis aries]|uniref:Uncharacterized protein n=1 Tax=Ovis ammon polii x Ovis aries TaxID=2918886 RepID=A0ACB9V0C2_9CETA|nr:hypothetical protein MJG53_008395 [Ovis ammon polii x Ovis aries]